MLRVARQIKRERDAAAFIQAHWRGKAARKLLGKMKFEFATTVKQQETAAKNLQSVFRGFKDRRVVKDMRRKAAMEKLKLEDLFSWGAITIQRTYRGYVRPLNLYRSIVALGCIVFEVSFEFPHPRCAWFGVFEVG